MKRVSQKGILKARIKELEEELERIKSELAVEFQKQAKGKEDRLVAEIVRLKGELEARNTKG